MIKNAVNMTCHVANHLNFSLFSIAKIFSLNQFIYCPLFAGILKSLIAYQRGISV